MLTKLKDEYSSEAEIRLAIAEYNKDISKHRECYLKKGSIFCVNKRNPFFNRSTVARSKAMWG